MSSKRQPIPIIRQTLLSRPPRGYSRSVALVSVVLLFVASSIYWENLYSLSNKLGAIPEKVFGDHEYWRIFTAMAVHSNLEHFLGNAISLGLLAYLLYGYFGALVFPFAAIILGAIANLMSLLTYPPHMELVGASGMIYVMAGFWLSVYFFTDRRFSLGSRFIRITGFAFVLLVPSTVLRGVSYRTHAIGFVLGMLFGLGYFFVNKGKIRSAEIVEYEKDEDDEDDDPPPWVELNV